MKIKTWYKKGGNGKEVQKSNQSKKKKGKGKKEKKIGKTKWQSYEV